MIISPYIYSEDEQQFIEGVGGNWDNNSGELNGLKDKIKMHLENITGSECYFCKIKVEEGITSIQLDHILFKSFYSNATFKPENLILSCGQCNTNKGEKEVLNDALRNINHSFNDYPLNSNDYTIIHPYIDNYYEHIHFPDGIFIEPVNNSLKGKETIRIYRLHRSALMESRIRKRREFLSDMMDDEIERNNKMDSELEKLIKDLSSERRKLKNLSNVVSSRFFNKSFDNLLKYENIFQVDQKLRDLTSSLFELMSEFDQINSLLRSLNKKTSIRNKIRIYLNSIGCNDLITGLINNSLRENLKHDINNDVIKFTKNTKKTSLEWLETINFSEEISSDLIEVFKNLDRLILIFKSINKMGLSEINIFDLSVSDIEDINENINELSKLSTNASQEYLNKNKCLLLMFEYVKFIEENNFLIKENLLLLIKNLSYIKNYS